MSKETDAGRGAVAAPVERPVRHDHVPLEDRLERDWADPVRRLALRKAQLDENKRLRDDVERLRACLHEVLEFQSDPTGPSIHDFYRWRRAADGLEA